MLIIVALLCLLINSASVPNAFFKAPNPKTYYLTVEQEFEHEKYKNLVIKRSPYGLKSSSASFRSSLDKKVD